MTRVTGVPALPCRIVPVCRRLLNRDWGRLVQVPQGQGGASFCPCPPAARHRRHRKTRMRAGATADTACNLPGALIVVSLSRETQHVRTNDRVAGLGRPRFLPPAFGGGRLL